MVKEVFNINNQGQKEPILNNEIGGMNEALNEYGSRDLEDFRSLYEKSLKNVEEGQILKGLVVEITSDYVTVDIGYKCEGQIPVEEFKKRDGTIGVKVGDEIDVLLERKDIEGGLLIISKVKADRMNIWSEVIKSFKEGTAIEGEVVSKVKGGLSVDFGGVIAFLPGSQIDLKPVKDLDSLIGKRFKFKVLKFNRKRNNIVLSRRILLEEEKKILREQTLKSLKEGDVVEGTVKNITDYGVFIDIGGIDGLIHISDLSWGRISHPSEKLKIGDKVKVKVLNFNREKEKISLGLKQTLPDPWNFVGEKYPIGSRARGKVVNIADYGAFVELEEGVEGLIHISELSWEKKMKHPSKIVNIGDNVEVIVLDCDPAKHRISLGMKQIEPNPWTLIEERYPVGTKVVRKVKTVTDFGIFLGFDEGIDGLVHISEMSWTKKIKHPSELYKKGQEVEAVVLNIDPKKERFSLGIKQLLPDPWKNVAQKYRKGDVISGKITNLTDFGAFVELEEGIEGLVHISEISREKINKPSDVLKVGEYVSAVILNIDSQEKKIGLSIKAWRERNEKADIEKYLASESRLAKTTLGELIQKKIEKKI